MSDYKDIHGTTVRNSDGVLTSAKTGELFYDSTNRNFSYRFPNVTSAGAWASGNNLNQARSNIYGAGTRDAAVAFGGQVGATLYDLTELYNGSSWTEV